MEQKSDHDMIRDMHTILCDTNGNDGLCTQFRKHKENDQTFRESYYRFRLLVIISATALLAGGGLGAWKAVSVIANFLH